MLIGGTGVGKSSLINVVFGKDVAEVGHGIPTSKGIKKFEILERDIIIYDSEGYEIGENKLEYFNSNIISTIESEVICTVWYCISTPNSRVTDYDKEIIVKIKSYNIPVHVVLTQADKSNPTKAQEMKAIVKAECGIESFLVTTNYIKFQNPKTNKEYGYIELEDLLKFTTENITDENLKLAFIREQKCSLKVKEEEAARIINQQSKLNTTEKILFINILLLLKNQFKMISKIMCIYELNEKELQIKDIIGNIETKDLIQFKENSMIKNLTLTQLLRFLLFF